MSVSRFLHKLAGAAHAAEIAPEVARVNEEARANAMRTVGNVALAGLGLGGGAAGLVALKNWLMKPKLPSVEVGLHPSEIDLAYPQFEGADITPGEARELKKRKARIEQAKLGSAQAGADKSWLEQLGEFGKGMYTQHAEAMPWFLPAVGVAGVGGVAGGAGLVNWLAARRRKAEEQAEMEDAKQEFEEAMLAQYSPERTHRLLGAKEAASEAASLDGLYEICKQAGHGKEGQYMTGLGTGLYGLLATALGLGTGYGTYHYLKSRSKSEQLEEALKARAAARAAQGPPELFIHPTAIKRKRPLPEEEEAAVSAGI